MDKTNSITCPNCGTTIDIDEIFYHQIESKLKQEHLAKQKALEDEIKSKREEYKRHLDTLKAQQEAMKLEKEKFDDMVKMATQKQLIEEKNKLYAKIKEEVAKEQQDSMKLLQDELRQKSKQIQELNTAKIEIEKLKREKEEIELQVKAKAQQELNAKLQEEKAKLQQSLKELTDSKLKEIQEAQELKLKEKDQQLEQLKKSLEDAKRKAEQGSMQVQGEALELEIESWLESHFPFDTITEVKKGAFGADCVQTIHTREMQNCGVICYESKNTKAWSDGWIDKLKQDMLKVKADIGVLVTSVYPNGMDRMGFVDGIWVCSLDEFKGSVALLRESLIRVHKSIQKEENKTDKMSMLYSYLTSNEFQMQLRAIVDGFMQMQNELDKEKRSLMASWKRRQKLIDKVLENTTQMYGSLQGIAGSGAIGYIDALELPQEIEEE